MKRGTMGRWAAAACAAWALAACVVAGAAEEKPPLAQIAILLDTSNSMDGLIQQAKTQLWKIVNELATAKKDGRAPLLQVALYEYGNNGISAKEGHVRQVLALTDDLDKVSAELFKLTTNGGQEYCGLVIQSAVRGLQWSPSNGDLKAIFIAGNEPFTQGPVDYREACKEAIGRGIVVNTIHCGSEQEGVNGKWKDGALLADGGFMTIDQNRAVVHIAAPQDKEIARLGEELNRTYVAYGAAGAEGRALQEAQDANAAKYAAAGSSVQRAVAKSNAQYTNVRWDLVDAVKDGKVKVSEVKEADLPENMRKMSVEERKAYVESQARQREEVQKKIQALNLEREKYVQEQLKKQAKPGEKTLDNAMIEALRAQAAKKQFQFDEKPN